ncbi:MAG TPA: hypothetical protein VGQ69_00570 [Gemmatimonadales bacterium]|jgi:hypothetical protein|nr:hypothetical protein [Gemmatimonadales bacterium]
MHLLPAGIGLALIPALLAAQAPGRFPPDSLVNTKVIPRDTPVTQVVGMMRNFAVELGVRCQFCHVGEEGMPLERFDFAKDEKPAKLIARGAMPTTSASLPSTSRPSGWGEPQRFEEALALLKLNEELFPGSSGLSVFRGNIHLRRGDTTAAATAFREAIRRDSSNAEARGRLRTIGKPPER